ncbi:MAG: hypothetical protein JEZ07_03685 [Phycisphaerae bacterium]|nr:hypothetical protein [Phycisphaerae bacterium]
MSATISKFTNLAGHPLGLAFYCLFLYNTIKVFNYPANWKSYFGLIFSISVGGFLYMPFLPAVLGISAFLVLLLLFLMKFAYIQKQYRTVLLFSGSVFFAFLLILPYLLTTIRSGSVEKAVTFFSFYYLGIHLLVILLNIFPVIFVLFFVARKFIIAQKTIPLLIVAISLFTSLGMYSFVHFNGFIEYKFLALFVLTAGIFGGIAFDLFIDKNKLCMITAFILLLSMNWPILYNMKREHYMYNSHPLPYFEKGKYIYSTDSQANEMYDWIRANTGINDVFVDTDYVLPVLTQRQLYIAVDLPDIQSPPGFEYKVADFVVARHGHSNQEYEQRWSVFNSIYQSNKISSFLDFDNYVNKAQSVFIVIRPTNSGVEIDRDFFELVFSSSGEKYFLYKYLTNK